MHLPNRDFVVEVLTWHFLPTDHRRITSVFTTATNDDGDTNSTPGTAGMPRQWLAYSMASTN